MHPAPPDATCHECRRSTPRELHPASSLVRPNETNLSGSPPPTPPGRNAYLGRIERVIRPRLVMHTSLCARSKRELTTRYHNPEMRTRLYVVAGATSPFEPIPRATC